MKKKIYVFVHIPKCFGTSFLNSIEENDLNNSKKDIAFVDLFHWAESVRHFFPRKNEIDLFKEDVLQPFQKSRVKNTVILHIHKNVYGIDSIIPEDIEREYIICMRNPLSRLKSAFRFRAEQTENRNYKTNGLFNSLVWSNGMETMIPNIFGLPRNYFIAYHHLKKINVIYLDDYVHKKHSVRHLEQKIGITLNAFHSNKMQIKMDLPPKNDVEFWDRMKNKLSEENRYYDFIDSSHFSNLFLCY